MRSASKNPRRLAGLILSGLLVAAASSLGGASPAAAFRISGVAHVGSFAHVGVGSSGRPTLGTRIPHEQITPRRSAGTRIAARPPVWRRRHPIVGGGFYPTPGSTISEFPPGDPRNNIYQQPASAGGNGSNNGGGNNGASGVPPQGERRFVPDEVVTAFSSSATPQAIDQIARRHGLTQLETQNLPLIGSTLYRWHIGGRRSVADTVGALESERAIASAQPNYIFALQEQLTKISAAMSGDPAQYVLAKLQIADAHRLATGKNVLVAVIDSEIDTSHPDLDGTIVKSFDALGGQANPHRHGTAMAGAIAAHGKLLGIAPGAQLLTAHAFDDTPGEAQGTSFAIYKSLQWAADNGARVVNMSFAGPQDPALHRMLAAAYEKGVVLIAAAGNAGANSAPLYPAADPDVIAVTATDSNDRVFNMANRGQYVAVAAPGVDILALAPSDSYEITTGTSIAAAHVSGIAALLLERQPSLKPSDIRTILMSSAKPLGPPGSHSDVGAGLVNAYLAVMLLNGGPVAKGDELQAKQ
jgi:subtilisin family serine protease